MLSFIGKPIRTDKVTGLLDKGRASFARALVEVDASKALIDSIPLSLPGGVEFSQRVVYEFEPRFCHTCRSIGHLADKCRHAVSAPAPAPASASVSAPVSSTAVGDASGVTPSALGTVAASGRGRGARATSVSRARRGRSEGASTSRHGRRDVVPPPSLTHSSVGGAPAVPSAPPVSSVPPPPVSRAPRAPRDPRPPPSASAPLSAPRVTRSSRFDILAPASAVDASVDADVLAAKALAKGKGKLHVDRAEDDVSSDDPDIPFVTVRKKNRKRKNKKGKSDGLGIEEGGRSIDHQHLRS